MRKRSTTYSRSLISSRKRLAPARLLALTHLCFFIGASLYSLSPVLFAQGVTLNSVITTVAGSSQPFRGAGGPAREASLGRVARVALDSSGNVFATDFQHHLVVRISSSGVLTVVAGNGIPGFSGEGGPATSASLNAPIGVTVDSTGNVYIADSGNHRIRRVTPQGTITTVAGNGQSGFGGDGGSARDALLFGPVEIAVDTVGTLYIADTGNDRIRKVSPTGIITTVVGNGQRGFSGDGGSPTDAMLTGPSGVSFGPQGELYVADSGNFRIRKIAANGTISTVAGNGVRGFSGDGGLATEAALSTPASVAVDSGGNLYIADSENDRARKVSVAGVISTVAGNGIRGFRGEGVAAVDASLTFPSDVAVGGDGSLYIADTVNARIRKVDSSGNISTVAGDGLSQFSGDGGPAVAALLNGPSHVAVDASGRLYIADTLNSRIRQVSAGGGITTFAGNGLFGFGGDNGPATAASLNFPFGIAFNSSGTLFIADEQNHRVRAVDPAGTITTVAGNGTPGFYGDGGPAQSATFNGPFGLTVGSAGELYISDSNNLRVRKVSDGNVTTVAGNGFQGSAGDNGSALDARLGFPTGLAVDASGNVFVADLNSHRIRKIATNGVITTVGGDGTPRYAGDGGPATSASLNTPREVAVDNIGNLYIADKENQRIRKVTTDGTITTIAGNGARGFSGDGGLATRAALSTPSGVALDVAGNLYIADENNDRVRVVLATPPSFSVSLARLEFSVPSGQHSEETKQVSLASSVTGVQWSARVSTASGSDWLVVSPGIGSAPALIEVGVNASGLLPGTFLGAITVDTLLAVPTTLEVVVELTVLPALPPRLRIEPSSMSIESNGGGIASTEQAIHINNGGGGTLEWTAEVRTTSGGNWLAVSPSAGTAAAGVKSALSVTLADESLPTGVYSGSVLVKSLTTVENVTVPVTLLVSRTTQSILVSQTGLLFTGIQGGTLVPEQSIGILNTGEGRMDWTVEATTTGGGEWLRVTPVEGHSTADSLEVPLVNVDVAVSGLTAGQYSGLIRVIAPGAKNSPQFVTVKLNVLPPGSNPGVVVRPTGLIFAARAGTSSPSSQSLRLATPTPGIVRFVSGLLTFDGENWLEALPRNSQVSPNDPRTVIIQPKLGSLPAGIYKGTLTLLFDDQTQSQVVDVLFLVVGPNRGETTGLSYGGQNLFIPLATGLAEETALPCVPQRLLAVHRTLGRNFSSTVGWPNTIEASVVDDCGNPVPNAAVVSSFSNGDPPVVLNSLRNGVYVATWLPAAATPQLTVTVRAELPPLAAVSVSVQAQVSSGAGASAVSSGGIVNAASYAAGEPVTPGGIISVFGRNLAQGRNTSTHLPLERSLGGATLSIGGIEAPLFFSSEGQINAQVPFELPPNTRSHVVVRTSRQDGSQGFALPETITVAAARPAIFTINQQGTGQGAILNQDYSANSATNAAERGSVIQIFATGLGATNPTVPSGQPAPGNPPALVTATVEAHIGGQPAAVQFAGLAPGFVGLYQVNVVVPPNVQNGAEAQLTLIQNDVSSNTVTVAIR